MFKKPKFRAVLKILSIFTTIALLVLVIAINIVGDFRINDLEVAQYFKEEGIDYQINNLKWKDKNIRYIKTGQERDLSDHLLVFIHGAPGASDAFNTYLSDSTLLQRASIISVDRIGYGYSDYGNSVGIQEQVAFIAWVLENNPAKRVLLIGHSYGGPIAAKCAHDHPSLIDRVVMIAPVIDPAHEKIFWFAHFCKWKATRWILPKATKVAGDEKFEHAHELLKIKSIWANLKVPITHIHGKKDRIAPIENAIFSKNEIPAHLLELKILENENHLIPFTKPEMILEMIYELIE